jgi:hypothetical protein
MKTHENRSFRRCALIALGQIGENPDQVIAEVLAILDNAKDEDRWCAAMGSLHALGEKGKPAVPGLLARFDTREAKVGKRPEDTSQRDTLVTIHSIDPENPQFLRLLQRILTDHTYDLTYRDRSLWCLENLGKGAKPCLPALVVAFRDNRRLAGRIANLMRPFKGDAVDALTNVMRTSNGQNCVRCIKAIGNMGKCASPSICYLQGRFTDPDPKVREAAQAAIRIIEMVRE